VASVAVNRVSQQAPMIQNTGRHFAQRGHDSILDFSANLDCDDGLFVSPQVEPLPAFE
jgi:hypothetical protein